MSYNVSVIYTGDIDSITKYLDEPVVSIVDHVVDYNKDIPCIKIVESKKVFVKMETAGNLNTVMFEDKEELLSDFDLGRRKKFGISRSKENIIGLHDITDCVTIGLDDIDDFDITIVSNAGFKEYVVPEDADLCILIDNRNSQLKLNGNLIKRVLGDFSGDLSIYSAISKEDLHTIVGDIEFEYYEI